MPYFTPPGGRLTAEYARALFGLLPARYTRPAIPAPVVMARAAQALRAAQAAGTMNLVMSGIGLGIIPSINVRYAKSAIPAALASRRWRELHPGGELQGLGRSNAAGVRPPTAAVGRALIAAAHPYDVFGSGDVPIAPIKRQAAFFMGPGGGPGGGPFQFPGFSGLGSLSDGGSCVYYGADGVTVESTDTSSNAAECAFNGGTWNPVPVATTPSPIPTTLTPTSPEIVAPLPARKLIPFIQPGQPTIYVPDPRYASAQSPSFFSSSTAGIPNAVLVGVGALLLLGLGRRRRNPTRARARSRRRRSR